MQLMNITQTICVCKTVDSGYDVIRPILDVAYT